MPTSIFVVSDLHLGGAAAAPGKPAFQITPEPNRRRLAEFFRWVATQHDPAAGRRAHLVLAGDVVDFLAEEPFAAFTPGDDAARAKLQQILDHTPEIWPALSHALAAGVELSILIGNHDLELCLPGPRRLLLQTLGPGRVEFVYDNQGFTLGPVLIEHGNRYDAWNAVAHDPLRELRSTASRREPPVAPFPAPPGSEMVQKVINPLKARYSFIDLLKPESSAVMPFLAVLDPRALKAFENVLGPFLRSRAVKFDGDGRPADRALIGAPVGGGAGGGGGGGGPSDAEAARAQAHVGLARELAGLGGAAARAEIGAPTMIGGLVDLWKAVTRPEDRQAQADRLLRALRAFLGEGDKTFHVNVEEATYVTPARAAAGRGCSVVIMGHTHLVKRVPLTLDAAGAPRPLAAGGAVYLNCGTWADLMCVPEAVWLPEAALAARADARDELLQFVADLAADRLASWRRSISTFSRVELDDAERVADADVWRFADGGAVSRVPDGIFTGRA